MEEVEMIEMIKELGCIIIDVREGCNLHEHLEKVEIRINELTESIDLAKAHGEHYSARANLKNELWRIKYEILEQI